jgi:NCAIR mutase (PurE)-related protein
MAQIARLPFVDTANARVDTHRALRHGIPEVVFGLGKTPAQVVEIVRALRGAGQETLVTRIEQPAADEVMEAVVGGEYDSVGRLLFYSRSSIDDGAASEPGQGEGKAVVRESSRGKGTIAVVSAGTADLSVAAEAVGVARCFGNEVETLQDVGVAGIHRLLASQDVLRRARVLIVVAGMEGALPSVVGGMVDKPVIAVPTSVGYGASLGGLAALLGMLTSCASNVTVVNIDNGFGAAYAATLINRL